MEFKPVNGVKQKPVDIEEGRSPVLRRNKQPCEECVKVYCRIKPVEKSDEPHQGISIVEGEHTMLLSNLDSNRPITKRYSFTEIFKDEPQHIVISRICDPVIDSVVRSNKKGGLIFAYGVTNSGKTHTILGTKEEPGILQYLFANLRKPFQLSPVEVYNEEFYLLTSPRRKLHLIQSSGSLEFKDFQPISVDESNIPSILEDIINNRAQKTTGFNSKSSRSHAIFRIKTQEGKIIGVVDLAGSQKSREGCSIEETTNINRSLLSLGRCIKCLHQQRTCKQFQLQIPFRQSKLTMALAEYFNPEFKLVMVVNINPSKSMLSETINILEYAAVARYVKHANTPTTSRYKNYNGSKAKALVTLEQTKSQDFEPLRSASPGKFGSSLKKMPSYTKQEPDDDSRIRGLQECIMNINLQELRKAYYEKYQAVSQVFDFMYEMEMEAQRKLTEQKLAKLRMECEQQAFRKAYVSTCVGTSPKPNYEAEAKQAEVESLHLQLLVCEQKIAQEERNRKHDVENIQIGVNTENEDKSEKKKQPSSFMSAISAPLKYLGQTITNAVRSLSPSKSAVQKSATKQNVCRNMPEVVEVKEHEGDEQQHQSEQRNPKEEEQSHKRKHREEKNKANKPKSRGRRSNTTNNRKSQDSKGVEEQKVQKGKKKQRNRTPEYEYEERTPLKERLRGARTKQH